MLKPLYGRIRLVPVLSLLIISIGTVTAYAQEPDRQAAAAETKQEVMKIAEAWTQAWNNEDFESMSELHDAELVYYWRGRPRGYEQFMRELRDYIFPGESISVELLDPQVQSLTPDAAVVGFQMRATESVTGDPEIAITLVLIRRASVWKIIHVHESPVR